MVLLAPAREGYLSLGPEGRLRAAEHDHLAEDLMLAWCHERMRNAEEPVYVVAGTLTRHNAHLTCWNLMIRIVHPPIVYIIIRHP